MTTRERIRPHSFDAGRIDTAQLELAFVLAPGQNLFFHELVAALRSEADALGVTTSVSVGNFPPPAPHKVYVVVPPHEYFTLMHGHRGPSPETFKRTICVCAEQPGTGHFDHNLAIAPRAGAIFDINLHAVEAFHESGIAARHLQLGWTQGWDHLRDSERDVDVLFMGCITDRRSAALASYVRTLWRRRNCLILSDNSRPNWQQSESFLVEDEKWDLLNRTKVLLNIHQGESPYFEWLRVVQAISNGAVVVSEHSLHHGPLIAGRHFLAGDIESLGLLTEALLDDGDRRWKMQTEAYNTVRNEIALGAAVQTLVDVARDIAAAAPLPNPADPFFYQPAPDPSEFAVFAEPDQPPSPAGGDHNAAMLRRASKDVKLELLDVRRDLRRLQLTLDLGRTPSRVELVRLSHAWHATAPQVSVLTALYNHGDHIGTALDSLSATFGPSWEVIVVDDGSRDGSAEVVSDWIDSHPDVAVALLRHPVNQGLGRTRNTALGWARAPYSFVLDADNAVYPHCFERLTTALDDDLGAALAYGILERFTSDGPIGLLNTLPWDVRRLRLGNYIDAMAMTRTAVVRDLGGYTVDRRLHGWEDFDLWCRLAENERYGAYVPEIVARYRTSQHSMLSLTNISASDAFSVLIERYPTVMQGLRPPD